MNDEKGIFLELYDNIEQTYITFKLLEPLDTLAKRAARSAASYIIRYEHKIIASWVL